MGKAKNLGSPELSTPAGKTAAGAEGEFGWHFTYQGSPANIVRKSYAIADDWVKGLATVERAVQAIHEGVDVYGRRDRTASRVPSDLPRYVQENRDKFAHMIGGTE